MSVKSVFRKFIGVIFFFFSVFIFPSSVRGQTPVERRYSIDELFDLALKNNQSLKISSTSVEQAQQRVVISKSQQLPSVSASLSAFYLGDATIFSSDFSNKTNVPMPHFGNSFILQASQLVYKGNAVRNSITLASLQHQLAALNFDKNKQDVKLLISGYYLELFRLRNQRSVYTKNIELTEIRLKNIEKMHEQGMVTESDVIRTKLVLSNLKLVLLQITDNVDILNNQLTTSVGLPADLVILTDIDILANKPALQSFDAYQKDALEGNFDIRSASQNVKISEKSLAISKAERVPVISLFAANSLQRPITSKTPALDMYSNGWQAGVTMSYNISSLYNAPKTIKMSRLQLAQAQQVLELQQQNTQIGVHSAYLKCTEAVKQWETTKVNLELALANYKTVENKYLNQLVLLIDMLDASNTRLDSELQQTNAEINVLFSYYKLMYTLGKL